MEHLSIPPLGKFPLGFPGESLISETTVAISWDPLVMATPVHFFVIDANSVLFIMEYIQKCKHTHR
jgi:hypothetical protein